MFFIKNSLQCRLDIRNRTKGTKYGKQSYINHVWKGLIKKEDVKHKAMYDKVNSRLRELVLCIEQMIQRHRSTRKFMKKKRTHCRRILKTVLATEC